MVKDLTKILLIITLYGSIVLAAEHEEVVIELTSIKPTPIVNPINKNYFGFQTKSTEDLFLRKLMLEKSIIETQKRADEIAESLWIGKEVKIGNQIVDKEKTIKALLNKISSAERGIVTINEEIGARLLGAREQVPFGQFLKKGTIISELPTDSQLACRRVGLLRRATNCVLVGFIGAKIVSDLYGPIQEQQLITDQNFCMENLTRGIIINGQSTKFNSDEAYRLCVRDIPTSNKILKTYFEYIEGNRLSQGLLSFGFSELMRPASQILKQEELERKQYTERELQRILNELN